MNCSFETIVFSKQTKTKIGRTTYIINSYFEDNGENLKEKIKNLLVSEVQKNLRKQLHRAKKCDII